MAKKIDSKDVEKDIENNDYEELSFEDRITNIEKKVNASFWLNIAILLLVIITLIFSLGNGTDLTTETPTTNSTEEVAYDTSAFKQISPSDIAKESDGKTIVVWVGRQSCGYCAMYAPNIAKAEGLSSPPLSYSFYQLPPLCRSLIRPKARLSCFMLFFSTSAT